MLYIATVRHSAVPSRNGMHSCSYCTSQTGGQPSRRRRLGWRKGSIHAEPHSCSSSASVVRSTEVLLTLLSWLSFSHAVRFTRTGGCSMWCHHPPDTRTFRKRTAHETFSSMGADEGSPTEIHPSHAGNLGWDGRGIPPSCFPPRRARPIAPHWRTRSTQRAGDGKGIIFAGTSFSAHLI